MNDKIMESNLIQKIINRAYLIKYIIKLIYKKRKLGKEIIIFHWSFRIIRQLDKSIGPLKPNTTFDKNAKQKWHYKLQLRSLLINS